ncbi:N-acetyltransferase [Pseudoalteromonas luteoviolacea]|uniref:acyltransferase n=1 Tax=Pseudoalteromonas luteoviolacea TaxID=43657 RepID=UPI001F43137D|nr:acyltransferase [Pseudoalteromonas luteoviolacea]MCF6439049.1 N-acetyltransferase [Pseudoalteromonas luteoviolacea]
MFIHETAIVSPKAKLGANVTVGPFSIIHDNVELGDDCHIEAYCELGKENGNTGSSPLKIGRNSLIRSHSVFYAASTIGDNLQTGHRVTVREHSQIGTDFQLGTLGDIQGFCEIGDYVKCHSNVHIGHHSKVGNFVWIFPYVVLTNDPHPPSEVQQGVTIGDYAVIATMSVILPGIQVEPDTLVGAGSIVGKDVPTGRVFVGNPAKDVCAIEKIKLKTADGGQAYPWRRHFHRGYPDNVVENWKFEFSGNDND